MTEPSNEIVSIVERIERLKAEQKAIGEDVNDIFKEAAGRGFDKAAIRECLKLRKMDKEKRRQLQDAIDSYSPQLGLL